MCLSFDVMGGIVILCGRNVRGHNDTCVRPVKLSKFI